jgi:hypothetical protein
MLERWARRVPVRWAQRVLPQVARLRLPELASWEPLMAVWTARVRGPLMAAEVPRG